MDVNERLVKMWEEDTAGRDVCSSMTDRLNGILSLESVDQETFENLKNVGFDHAKVSNLIAQACEESATLADTLPDVEVEEEEPLNFGVDEEET